METVNIIISGVGGQGIILLSNVLANLALENNLDVKKSEVHGMAQRGGSVVSFVRIGEKIFSPLIPVGKGDILVSMELMESLRWIEYVKNGGTALINDYRLPPPGVAMGIEKYPEGIEEKFGEKDVKVFVKRVTNEAVKLGNPRVTNIILLGMLSRFLTFEVSSYYNAIRKSVKPQFLELNLKAFERGRELIEL